MEKYSRVKQLGKGSFGAAFLVKRIRDGAQFVVKEVSLTKMTTKEKEEARHEVRILSQLSHPNITQYTEHVEKNGVLCIVMEFADGGDLYQRIKASAAAKYSRKAGYFGGGANSDEQYEGMLQRKGPGASGMTETLMMHYFAQICLAIDYLHSKHILHRDIKSMNVFLTSRGTVKVGDFGISTILRNTIGMAKTVCGTPYYFSPELCRSKPYNNKSDVWALGIVLYEMANVKHPFDASSMAALMQKICKGVYLQLPAATPNNPNSGFSKGFLSLIARCLDVNVVTRYNIKQVLATDILRSALDRLEKDLMLATVCKVRLQTVIGHFDQREQGLSRPSQQVPPSSNPSAVRVSPAPMTPVGNNNIPTPNINKAVQREPEISNQRVNVGPSVPRSEAIQVQKEIEKVDKLIAFLKQPQPPLGGGPLKNIPTPQPPQQLINRNAVSPAATPRDRDEATAEYIKKHNELQQIMAAHKKKVEANLRKRQEQEEAYQKEILAKRHQYQIDNRPRGIPKKEADALPPSNIQPQNGEAVPPAGNRLPPLSTPRSAQAANCLPQPEKKDRQAAAAEAWLAEQRRQEARKKAAAEEKRARAKVTDERQAPLNDIQGIGEYFDRRRREQEKDALPLGGKVDKADMPACVGARKRILGEDPLVVVPSDQAEGKGSAPPRSRSPQPVQPQPPSLQPPKTSSPVSRLRELTPTPSEPEGTRPANQRPSAGRASPQPVLVKALPPIDAGKLPKGFVNKQVEDHVNAIEGQMRALAGADRDRRSSEWRDDKTAELRDLLESFTRRDSNVPTLNVLPPIINRASAPKNFSQQQSEPESVGDEDDIDDEVSQTLRQHDYGNMLKHIQGLNVMFGDLNKMNKLHDMGDKVALTEKSDDLRSDLVPSEENVETENFEEVIDTSCYIGNSRESASSDSNASDTESEVDTILDATVRGAVGVQDFGDVEPLTPSRQRGKGTSENGAPPDPSSGDAIFFFRLAHLCGSHFDGQWPVLLSGAEVELKSVSSSGEFLDKQTGAKIVVGLEKYVSDQISNMLSEDAVTPRDKPQEGPRYRREAATFITLLLSRLLNSIGPEGDEEIDEERQQQDDDALSCAKRLIQLVLQASAGGASSAPVALTYLLSVCRKGLYAAPGVVDDRAAVEGVPSRERMEALSKLSVYIRALCKVIKDTTSSDSSKTITIPVEGEDGYFSETIAELVSLISQLLYFKSIR